jgi:protein-tyrosine phosphatase
MKSSLLLSIAILLFTTSCKFEEESSPEPFVRYIELQGEPNFRDLGNYKTSEGKTIKNGILYRSGTLAHLTEEDKGVIETLGIKTVVNFLLEEERQFRGNDNLPEGVSSIYLPIEGQAGEVSAIIEARKTGVFSEVPADFNFQIHKILPETGKQSYVELINLLADKNNYPIVFHCSHGVHRTGTAAALIMSVLGVPWETVEKDYLLSNKYRENLYQKRIVQLDSMARVTNEAENLELDLGVNKSNIDAFYILQAEYVAGTKSHVDENYGSFENYFLKSGVTNKTLEEVKSNLLK